MTGFVRHLCTKQNASLRLLKFTFLQERSYTSALYVPGKLAHKTFAYLSPHLDFADRFSDLDRFQRDLDSRGLNVDVAELKKTWDYYQYVISNKHILEEKQDKLSSQIKSIQKKGDLTPEDEKEIEVLMTKSKFLKQEMKPIKEANWTLEESLIPELLKLPNEINELTPLDAPVVLRTVGDKPNVPEHKRQSHLDIGKNLNLLDYRNPIQCYLCNEAVSFELGIASHAGKILNDNGALRVAGPDFSRSAIVEGCGLDHESPTETFILQNVDVAEKGHLVNRLHLVGGASLPALLAMFTKQLVRPKYLPMRIFTTGRQYSPSPSSPASYGLFAACQATAVQALTLLDGKNAEACKAEFENLVDWTCAIYDDLGCHYRVVLRSAKELAASDSMKVSVEMWSAYSERYVEVGNVSACGDYFSKRLLVGYQSSNIHDYASVIGGTLVSVPRLLGCLLEQNPDGFVLPEKLRELAC